ncbi:MAG TPA: DUF3107 domain-containing protein [Acidimicrobiales bacterium]|nr:DUF3107 domain-containing protein [Acidimicrobiales bacterium]
MDVRIGVTYTAKEIDVELADDTDADKLQGDVDAAISGDAPVFWITDRKGRRVGVPTEKIAYVEIGSPEAARRIGFGG